MSRLKRGTVDFLARLRLFSLRRGNKHKLTRGQPMISDRNFVIIGEKCQSETTFDVLACTDCDGQVIEDGFTRLRCRTCFEAGGVAVKSCMLKPTPRDAQDAAGRR